VSLSQGNTGAFVLSLGRRIQLMHGPLLDCPVHGIREDRSGIVLGPGSRLSLAGSTGECPACGRPSPYIDGNYANDSQDQMHASLRPTPAQARRLEVALQWAQQHQGTVAPDKLARDLEKSARSNIPGFGVILDKISSKESMAAAAWLTILLMLVQMIVGGQPLSEDDVERVVRETVVQQQQIEDSQPDRAAPTPAVPPTAPEVPTEAPPGGTEPQSR
jgi:hypothetical protein